MTHLSRREFLSGVVRGAGLTLAVALAPFRIRVVRAATPSSTAPDFDPAVWLRIAPDETITVVVAQTEMGQGISTGLAMVVAEEMDADWSRVRFEPAPATDPYVEPRSRLQFTGGSQSMRLRYEQMRRVGAAARVMMVRAAARAWRVSPAECETSEGRVLHRRTGRVLTYGSLASRASRERVPPRPPLKPLDRSRLVGRSLPRLDIPDKVLGRARYGMDTVVDGMCYASLARPPRWGATAEDMDLGAAERTPGVIAVVPLATGVAVCAESLEAAWKGREALRVRFGPGAHPDLDDAQIERSLVARLEGHGATERDGASVLDVLSRSAKVVEARYHLPFLSHAAMEPMSCVAHVQRDRCDVWGPTQAQTGARAMAARETGLPLDRVHVHVPYGAGAFGRYNDTDFLREAVLISKAVGRPVKVVWTREEDLTHDFFRPASASWVRAGLDGEGRVTAWWHRIAAPSIAARVVPMWQEAGIAPAAVETAARRLDLGVDHFGVEGMDPFQYEVPSLHVEFVASDLPVPVGLWRSPGHNQNGFVIESFVDEMAHAAGKDPLEFRLGLLRDRPRERRVLEVAAEKAGWGKPPRRGQALGIARYSSCGSHAAHVAEVSVDRDRGLVTVHRVVGVMDCGLVVHPDAVSAQMEGCIVMGVGTALFERVRFAGGAVVTRNFDTYRIPRMSDGPEVEVHVIPSREPLGGAGEPGLPSVAPAVANAVFWASGIRVRRLPFSPEALRSGARP